jgi:hypothetical protein
MVSGSLEKEPLRYNQGDKTTLDFLDSGGPFHLGGDQPVQ